MEEVYNVRILAILSELYRRPEHLFLNFILASGKTDFEVNNPILSNNQELQHK